MRLPHMRKAAPEVLATAKAQRWDPAEVLRVLLAEEVTGRERSALATRRAAAGFPTGKTFDAWNPDASSIPAPTQQALRTLEWVHRRENLVVCGPSGTGKTFLLEALGPAGRRGRAARGLATPGRPRRAAAPAPRRRHRRQSHHPATQSRTRHRRRHRAAPGGHRRRRRPLPPRRRRLRETLHRDLARTCTPPASTSSCPKRWPPPPSTGYCTTPTSAKPAATASASPKPSPAKG
ncbi:MAG: ATP-binding protein [Candidatus Nanopelagicales bacterium]